MGIRHMPVVDADGSVVGIVSDRDIKLAWTRGPDTQVGDAMSKYVQWVHPDHPARRAVEIMITRKIGSVPVIADGLLVGIVTETDFLRLADQTLAAELPTCP